MKILIKIFLFVFIFLGCEVLHSQLITWQRTYGDDNINYGYASVQTSDEGFIVVGRTRIINADKIIAIRLNKNGDVIWNKTFNGYQANQIEKTSDGNFIICGSNLIKIDLNGDTIWTNPNASGNRLREIADSGFVICRSKQTGPFTFEPELIKVDVSGNLVWTKSYSNGIYDGGFSSICINSKGELVMTGVYSVSDSLLDNLFIMKTDVDGNFRWFNGLDSLHFHYPNTIVSKKNLYSVSGDDFIAHFDSSGNLTSIKRNFLQNLPMNFKNMILTSDNGFALTGMWDSASTFDYFVFLLKLDSTDNEQFHKSYGFQDFDVGFHVAETSDKGFVITGIRDNYRLGDIYVIKTDSDGFANPPVSIQNQNTLFTSNFELFQNYPNPFNLNCKIQFRLGIDAFVEINIYDVQGRKIENLISENRKKGNYTIDFDGSSFSSGIYFYSLTYGNQQTLSKKMLIIK